MTIQLHLLCLPEIQSFFKKLGFNFLNLIYRKVSPPSGHNPFFQPLPYQRISRRNSQVSLPKLACFLEVRTLILQNAQREVG